MRRPSRVIAATCVATCAMAIGPLTAAQASNATIIGSITRALPSITKSQGAVADGLATYEKTVSPAKLITAVTAQNVILKALRTHVSGDAASTANGAKGRTDIVKGLTLIIDSNTTLTKALRKRERGAPISKAAVDAAVKADHTGNADLKAGIKEFTRV